ncbi:MAG: hypothetical protein A3E84_00940 [Gammaproteobacteria bacterium RIFCSPHIGHO2_12_FULL_42_13]|nr:MAG: hypothetical protein A3E84_00940 [Gammaproteobacteria bacterium RIFCSPHIGHO2_12_FULL_42_13]
MLMFHTALSLSLISLTAGLALYLYANRCDGKGTCFAKTLAALVILISIISSACTIYCGVRCWQGDHDRCQMCMMQDKEMMNAKGKPGEMGTSGMMKDKNLQH